MWYEKCGIAILEKHCHKKTIDNLTRLTNNKASLASKLQKNYEILTGTVLNINSN